MVKFTSTPTFLEQDLKPKRKRQHKNYKYDHKLEEGVDDVVEDDDVLPNDLQLPHVQQKVNPSHSYGQRGHPPDPAGLKVSFKIFSLILQCSC